MMLTDPRTTPARPDLAADFLAGTVVATRYVRARERRIVAASAPLRREPRPDAPLDTEALAGEAVRVFEEEEGWAWAQLAGDGYVGYLPVSALGAFEPAPTHRVAVLRTFVYPGPSIKLPPVGALSLMAGVTVSGFEGDFARLADGSAIFARHLAFVGPPLADDFVTIAERFVGVPYLWGGKTSLGIDCSGLVQLALSAAAVEAPRDSDLQERTLGSPLPITEEFTGLRRGDLVFWKGHVGIMVDSANLLHANGHHMATVIEPLAVAAARIEAAGAGPVTSIKRL
ncbi:C40 family peptidase [Chelatococcus daeguensis]|uniref:C40 family peptidase n=1 Tax=Chelatococcus daeguensis TaxID=444444 RepID=UPI0007AB655E|nr:NlpC/P60 family protein [Chelatococcus daeguensis]KZE36234.1 peptidase P60 [Chelatococcus daeguensis]MBM3084295.1 C40 family peptidase [Chelatococcus daeguensis]